MKRKRATTEQYVAVTLVQQGDREGNIVLYAPRSVLEKLAEMLKAQRTDENIDAIGWFRELVTWEGKPTKKCPVVGAGAKGATGFGNAKLAIELDPTDEYSVDDLIMEFGKEERE